MSYKKLIDNYIIEIQTIGKQYFPKNTLKTVYRRLNQFSGRLEIKSALFIDLYYNAENGRRDFSLIERGKRVFGYDNLGGWHRHPLKNPEVHIKCNEPPIEKIFQEIKEIVSS